MKEKTVSKGPSTERVGAVDTMKGIAIILMVIGHIQQGAMHRRLWGVSPSVTHAVHFADACIYSFHMAVFFFVAGLFLERSVHRRGMIRFILEKAKTILYPYVLWGILFGLLASLTTKFRVTEQPTNWQSVLIGLITGNSSWFLITLFVSQMLSLLLFRLPFWARMAIAVGATYVIPSTGTTVLIAPFQYLPFLIAGMWFSGDRLTMLGQVQKARAGIVFVLLLAAQLTLIYLLGPVTRWDSLPLGLNGIAMVLFLGYAIRGSRVDRILQWYGAGSLGVFLLHPIFQGAGREFVTRVLHTTHPLPYLGITTAIAATIPVVIWNLQDRLHFSFLFHWPSKKTSVASSKAQPVAG